jgi:hypothetical protein
VLPILFYKQQAAKGCNVNELAIVQFGSLKMCLPVALAAAVAMALAAKGNVVRMSRV